MAAGAAHRRRSRREHGLRLDRDLLGTAVDTTARGGGSQPRLKRDDDTLPAGGALAMGVSWAMLSGWGISTADYVLYSLVSGVWNVFARLSLPVLALLVLLTARSRMPA